MNEVNELVVLAVEMGVGVHEDHVRMLRGQRLHNERVNAICLNLPTDGRVADLEEVNYRWIGSVVGRQRVVANISRIWSVSASRIKSR